MAVPVTGPAGNRPGRMFMHRRHLGDVRICRREGGLPSDPASAELDNRRANARTDKPGVTPLVFGVRRGIACGQASRANRAP